MIGKTFGIYLVLEKDLELSQQKKKIYWKCQCQKCNTQRSVRSDNLMRLPKSCPNCKNDLTGQKFGRLTALQKTRKDSNGHNYWLCQCDCGNIKEVNASNLLLKVVQSCGCLHSEICSKKGLIDISGQQFGKLTVIKRANKIGDKRVTWECLCECGNTIIVQGNNLKNGHTTSCGCTRSKGELKIKNILNELNIPFKTEYIFQQLPKRRFDFYLPDYNLCIEYDGKQHFEIVSWHKTIENFKNLQARDMEKNQFCLNNNIKLIRIPYTDYEIINTDYIKNIIYGENT